MKTHTFRVVLERPSEVYPELEDAVFEAGCGDAALGQRSGVAYLEFDRRAPSFLDAVLSAIRDLNTIPGTAVARVEPDELVTASEIAHRIGRTRESVRLWIEGERGPGGFPVAVSGTGGRRTRLWRWSEVAEWLSDHGLRSEEAAEFRVIAAVNGALDLLRNADAATGERILEAVRRAA